MKKNNGIKIRIACHMSKEREMIRKEMKRIRKTRKDICQIGQQECVGNNETIERKEPKKSLSLNDHISVNVRPIALKAHQNEADRQTDQLRVHSEPYNAAAPR